MMSVPRASVAATSTPPKRARILAIDYGRRRIGLAITDELGLTASPLPVMERKNRRDDLRRLRKLLEEYQVALVLVGNPVHLSGRRGEMADEAARFARRIEKELKVKVELCDERLTSWQAKEVLKETSGAKSKKREIDSMAAAIVLREYLDATRAQQNS
jgi:putative pre-16S rRNA nuclease